MPASPSSTLFRCETCAEPMASFVAFPPSLSASPLTFQAVEREARRVLTDHRRRCGSGIPALLTRPA